MAIDTQQKRMSVMGVGRPWMRAHFPGTINAAWRLATGNVYSGNAVTTIVVTDARTASGRLIVAFADGDQFRLRAIRTEGGSDLQTIQNGSAMTAVVYRN